MANYHVSKDNSRSERKWRVTREGAGRVSTYADTQKKAELLAKQFSANSGGGEVRINDLKGKIRDSDTVEPGNDPKASKDTRH